MAEDQEKPGKKKSLEYLRRDLYAKKESDEIVQRQEDLGQMGVQREITKTIQPEQFPEKLQYQDLVAQRRRRWLRAGRWFVLGFIALVLLAVAIWGTLWYRASRNVTDRHIGLEVRGPEDVTAGMDVEYVVIYKNNSLVDWERVDLVFTMPQGFQLLQTSSDLERRGGQYFLTVGGLASQEEGSFTFGGQIVGEQNASVVFTSELSLTPVNFPSGRFSREASLASTITAMPFDISIAASSEASAGERVLAEIVVRSLGEESVEAVYLALEPAAGLELAIEDPQFSPGFSATSGGWDLPKLEPLEEEKRTVVLFAKGDPGQQRLLNVVVGIREGDREFVQRSVAHVLTLTATELVAEQRYNDTLETTVVEAGKRVRGSIQYKNTGSVGLRDVILKTTFEGPGFDAASLKLDAGAYDSVTRTITWSAATVPQLALLNPQDTGEVSFEFSTRSLQALLEDSDEEVDNLIISTTTIDSPDIPTPAGQERKIVTDRYVLALGTDITTAVDAFYDDGRIGITSSGPKPPKVGEETTYTVRMRLGSTISDVGEVVVTATLPDGVRYTGETFQTNGEIRFNERTGELEWVLPLVPAQAGIRTPAEELDFQVAVVPAENQVGEDIEFLNRLSIQGTDQSTEQKIEKSVTNFPSTETASPGEGIVVP